MCTPFDVNERAGRDSAPDSGRRRPRTGVDAIGAANRPRRRALDGVSRALRGVAKKAPRCAGTSPAVRTLRTLTPNRSSRPSLMHKKAAQSDATASAKLDRVRCPERLSGARSSCSSLRCDSSAARRLSEHPLLDLPRRYRREVQRSDGSKPTTRPTRTNSSDGAAPISTVVGHWGPLANATSGTQTAPE